MRGFGGVVFGLGLGLCVASGCAIGGTLQLERLTQRCDSAYPVAITVGHSAPPQAAQQRLAHSQLVSGTRDIAWAWLGAPTARYPHTALGSREHAAQLHVLARDARGDLTEVIYTLGLTSVFEDLVPRLVDLDGDGRDEVVLVQADAAQGGRLVALGLRGVPATPGMPVGAQQPKALVELARGPAMGSSFRWLNPLGFADFDGDGKLDVASVSTPHIGGELVLHHYRPPQLVPYAKLLDVSTHRYGAIEQRLGLVIAPTLPGQRPSILLPDMARRNLQWLRWAAHGDWEMLAAPLTFPANLERLTAAPGGACVELADRSAWRVTW